MTKVGIPAAPGRLINAVARIGYDPEVALCDLIDNSIDAASHAISVTLLPEFHGEEGETDTIARYVIADDGAGMDREALINAFTLGSPRQYLPHALGKFGLGLKSAGLSLGNQIVLLSKTQEMTHPLCAVLSIEHVEKSGRYEIDLGDLPPEYEESWSQFYPARQREHGTTLIIEDLSQNQPSYGRFLPYLRRYCSAVYHMFLEDAERVLRIQINDENIEAVDPLFMAEARLHGSLQNPQDWDGRTVSLLLDNHDFPLTPSVKATIALTHLVHPPTFAVEGRRPEIRDQYLIEADPYTGRARHGFYVYRHRRVIVLAERFHGLVSAQTQAWAFRGRIMFDESADKILSLDVKKRHCQLPKEARNNLLAIVRSHQQRSVSAWTAAGRRVEAEKGESKEKYANESIASTPAVDLGYSPGTDLSSQAAVEARARLLGEIGEETLRNITDSKVSRESLDQSAEAKSAVILVEGLRGNAMWLPYPAVQHGAAETLVNKTHSWIAEAYAAAEDDPRIMVILHQLFTILARAELEVRSTAWRDPTQGAVDKVFGLLRRKASAIAEDLADALRSELTKLGENPQAWEE